MYYVRSVVWQKILYLNLKQTQSASLLGCFWHSISSFGLYFDMKSQLDQLLFFSIAMKSIELMK